MAALIIDVPFDEVERGFVIQMLQDCVGEGNHEPMLGLFEEFIYACGLETNKYSLITGEMELCYEACNQFILFLKGNCRINRTRK